MKILLRIVMLIALLLLVVIAGAAAFLFTFDLNRLKPTLQEAAAKHGATLDIPGNLGWQLWPNLGLQLGSMSLHNSVSGEHLAAIELASVTVQLQPLFKRQIIVNGIQLTGMNATYKVDAKGVSPWQPILDSLAAAPEQPAPTAKGHTANPPSVEIQAINLSNFSVNYSDAKSGTQAELRHINISSENLAINGEPFPIRLDGQITYNDYPQLQIQWSSPISLNLAKQTLLIDAGKAQLNTKEVQADLVLSTQTQWGAKLTSQGHVELISKNLRALLKSLKMDTLKPSSSDALQSINVQFKYDFSEQNLKIQDIKLRLDNTDLKGDVSVSHFEKPKIISHWQGTKINLDSYLPPPSTTPEEPAPAAPPQPLPLDTLRNLNVDFSLTFDEIIKNKIALTNNTLEVTAKKGLITLSNLNSTVASGKIVGKGFFDARSNNPSLEMTVDSKGVDVGKLLTILANQDQLAGLVSAEIRLTSQGNTDKALADNLQAKVVAQSAGLKIIPFNIEEQFCKAIAILQQAQPMEFEWPKQTVLEPVHLQLSFAQNTVNLEELNADIANLFGKAQGQFNLASGKFNFPFSLSLGEFADSLPGCLPIDPKWRKRALPLRCKGSLDNIGVKTCLPDTKLLTAMLKDKVSEKLNEKLEKEKDRVEKKLGDKTKELLKKEMGDEKAKKTEDTLREILNQVKKK